MHTRRSVQNRLSAVRYEWQWHRELQWILRNHQKNRPSSEDPVPIGFKFRSTLFRKGKFSTRNKWKKWFLLIFFSRQKDKTRGITYAEFTQLLHDFHEEHAKEAFKSKDPNGTGYISPLDFLDIMVNVKKHLLTHDVKDNLVAVSIRPTIGLGCTCISLPNNFKINFLSRICIPGDRRSKSELRLFYGLQFIAQQYGTN